MGWLGLTTEDDGLAEGKIVVRMNPDLWMNLQNAENPEGFLAERALEELRMNYGYDESEIGFVDEDPVFHESVVEEYRRAQSMWKGKGKIPRTIKITFGRPANRKANGKSMPPEAN